MKRLILPLAGMIMFIMILGCDNANESDYREQIVLQGIMYVDQPLKVRLAHTLPMHDAYNNRTDGVSGALVQVTTGDSTYTLAELPTDTSGNGYYEVVDTSVKVTPGNAYRIHVETGEHRLDAQTTSAGTTGFVSQSADTIEYGDTELLLRWHRDSLAVGYALLIENMEPDWFEDYREVSGNNGTNTVPWTVWVAYGYEDSLRVPWVVLGFTGQYRVRLLTCDLNLWNYMWTYYPGMAENYPVSNVNGGLGVFAAADADTTYFMLTDSISDGSSSP